ncbi:hypothetical protein [Sphingobacterium siyangense]
MNAIDSESFLLPQIHGRSIFKRVIPTVNYLERTFKSLEQNRWSYTDLKSWEQQIIKGYALQDIIHELRTEDQQSKVSIVRNQILKHNANDLGTYPLAIYLIVYFIQQTESNQYKSFVEFAQDNGITQNLNSISAIWSCGTKDGKYLGILDDSLKIIDIDFLHIWANSTPSSIRKEKLKITVSTAPPLTESSYNDHMECFKASINEAPRFTGVNSFKWSEYVMGKEYDIPQAFNKKFDRLQVWDYCGNSTNTDLDALLVVLSWGGMDRKHAKSLLNNPGPVLDIVRGLRSEKFKSRKEAFEYIQDKRKQGLLPGMGIGYFTKLICFLQPSLNGYIMDQWLAKSVNLLLGNPLIHIASKTWVSDQNTPAIYEEFCTYIDNLASEIGKSGFDTEEFLFSIGGRKKGMWRGHVVQHY